MHIVECYFEAIGFDHRLLRGGPAVYIWNLAQRFVAAGHRVSVVTASHGQLDLLREQHELRELPYRHDHHLPLRLDPAVWGALAHTDLPLQTRVWHVQVQGVDFYLLDNELLRRYPDSAYPPYESKGRDLGFHKPLAYQVDAIQFIRQHLLAEAGEREPLLVHAHEPYYQYLLPLAFRDDTRVRLVSTVQSNMPVDKKVYRPKVEALLDFLGVPADLSAYEDPPLPTDPLHDCWREALPRTHLHYAYPAGYMNLLAPLLEHSEQVDFLSPGQLDFYTGFRNTPFEDLYPRLGVARVMAAQRHKCFVGWCALSDAWHAFDPAQVDRAAVLQGLGLDPARPTFFHNARYAVQHKGQVELMRAIARVLEAGAEANFIVRCISATGIAHDEFHAIQARFPERLQLQWQMVPEARLMELAAACEFALFPSKFEMDTFLIAQGEAMRVGAVPIGTLQCGTLHFEHNRPLHDPEATGLALPRSFAEDDRWLEDALVARIQQALQIWQAEPATYQRLRANARRVAARFTWERAAQAHLQAFLNPPRPTLRSVSLFSRAPGQQRFEEQALPLAANGGFTLPPAGPAQQRVLRTTHASGRVQWEALSDA